MRRATVLFVAMASLAGCQPEFSTVELEAVSSPPVGVTTVVRDDEVEVPAGVAIAVEVTPLSGNSTPYSGEDKIRLHGRDESVLDAEPTEERRVFVLIGVSPGTTCIEVEINGSEKTCIDATVTAE